MIERGNELPLEGCSELLASFPVVRSQVTLSIAAPGSHHVRKLEHSENSNAASFVKASLVVVIRGYLACHAPSIVTCRLAPPSDISCECPCHGCGFSARAPPMSNAAVCRSSILHPSSNEIPPLEFDEAASLRAHTCPSSFHKRRFLIPGEPLLLFRLLSAVKTVRPCHRKVPSSL
jgi:hypothetical protein